MTVGSSCGLDALTWPLQWTLQLGRAFAGDENERGRWAAWWGHFWLVSACCYSGCCCFQLSLTKSFGSCTPSCSCNLQIKIGRWWERGRKDLQSNHRKLWTCFLIQGTERCPFAVGTLWPSWHLTSLRNLQMLQGRAGYLLCGIVCSPWACNTAVI